MAQLVHHVLALYTSGASHIPAAQKSPLAQTTITPKW